MIDHLSGDDFLALVGQRTTLRKVAATNGGEWAGACPLCGGKDRFRVQPHGDSGGRWWCRGCRMGQPWASDIDFIFLRDHGFIPTKDHPDWPVLIKAAFEALGLTITRSAKESRSVPDPEPPSACEPPGTQWQQMGLSFLGYCVDMLWKDAAADSTPLTYLRQRGLSDHTIRTAAIGYNPKPLNRPLHRWGLDDPDKDGVWLPAGYVIPWFCDGQLWKLSIRQTNPRDEGFKYVTVAGSSNVPYGIDTLRPGQPSIFVEGPIDALVAQQALGQFERRGTPLAGVVAVGTTQGRAFRWLVQYSLCQPLFIATDADAAGDKSAAFWLDIFKGKEVYRMRPDPHDFGTMVAQCGIDLRAWIATHLDQWWMGITRTDLQSAAS
ncbi:MAG: toprim domain-containing protein [Chloroflexi bacterium]|nr:toprim domain-containing protein [Chloroflexota bacterium]